MRESKLCQQEGFENLLVARGRGKVEEKFQMEGAFGTDPAEGWSLQEAVGTWGSPC